MPRTKSKTNKPAPSPARVVAAPCPTTETPEVLTLTEAAAYLRVSEQDLMQMVGRPDFPGRMVGAEWRFLKCALQDWLRTPPPRPSKEAVLARIGSWKDDPYLDEMLKEIYKQRGRPMTEEGE